MAQGRRKAIAIFRIIEFNSLRNTAWHENDRQQIPLGKDCDIYADLDGSGELLALLLLHSIQLQYTGGKSRECNVSSEEFKITIMPSYVLNGPAIGKSNGSRKAEDDGIAHGVRIVPRVTERVQCRGKESRLCFYRFYHPRFATEGTSSRRS